MRRTLSLIAAAGLTLGIASAAQAQTHNHGAAPAPVQKAVEQPAASTGKVNRVEAGKKVVNLTHGPIPALGWPAMTMDFGVAPAVDLSALKVGDTVAFTVGKGAKGVYLIDSIKPAK